MKRWLIICSSISGSLLLIGCFDFGHWGVFYSEKGGESRDLVLLPGEISFQRSAHNDPFGLGGFSWGGSLVDPFAAPAPRGGSYADLFSEITFSIGNLAKMPRSNQNYTAIPFWLISLMVFSALFIPVFLRRRKQAAEIPEIETDK